MLKDGQMIFYTLPRIVTIFSVVSISKLSSKVSVIAGTTCFIRVRNTNELTVYIIMDKRMINLYWTV